MSFTSDKPLPKIATLGLVMAGLGLVGMTAGDLPGIAEQLAAPRWLMGVLGGALCGSGWQAGRIATSAASLRRAPQWVELIAFGVAGIVLARLSDLTRDSAGAALITGTALNSAARVLFGIGIGIIIGWVAYEGSRGRSGRG
ncbi:MAG: hypothetical protein NTZ79_06680 [Proteobacteria bacterium]|nr:hypothetical protein [Pseudomonadota bacterium]